MSCVFTRPAAKCLVYLALQKKIVAKIFPESELEYSFQNELAAYSSLHSLNRHLGGKSKYFLHYYGSFTQDGRGVILLEYADQRSLLDFFQRGDIPYTLEEMVGLWRSLVDLLRGLGELHHLDRTKSENRLRGVHQDLQPSNIFVFSDGDSSAYQFRFKLGDFGLSGFNPEDKPIPDCQGTKTYGPPECMSWDPEAYHLRGFVSPDGDIWALGCVLLETAVWSVCGIRGLEEFRRDRELENLRFHTSQACPSSFHNGKTRLQAVHLMAEKLQDRRRVHDSLTQPLCKMLYEQLLIPKEQGRLSASQAVHRLIDIIDAAAKATNPDAGPNTGLGYEPIVTPTSASSMSPRAFNPPNYRGHPVSQSPDSEWSPPLQPPSPSPMLWANTRPNETPRRQNPYIGGAWGEDVTAVPSTAPLNKANSWKQPPPLTGRPSSHLDAQTGSDLGHNSFSSSRASNVPEMLRDTTLRESPGPIPTQVTRPPPQPLPSRLPGHGTIRTTEALHKVDGITMPQLILWKEARRSARSHGIKQEPLPAELQSVADLLRNRDQVRPAVVSSCWVLRPLISASGLSRRQLV